MNDKVSQTTPTSKDSKAETHSALDMEELKRDMRNAQLVDWAKQNQSKLIAVAVLVVLIFGGAMAWIEKNKSEHNAAAAIYYQSLAAVDDSDKKKLLNALIDRHFGTAYTALAEMQLARLDSAHAKAHLQAVINDSKSMPQWVWQARLDLARLLLSEGKAAEATPLLQDHVGAAYEQLRQYLMAKASSDAADKISHLELAQTAQSHDDALKRRIDSELKELKARKNPSAGS